MRVIVRAWRGAVILPLSQQAGRVVGNQLQETHRQQGKRDLHGLQDIKPLVKGVELGAARLPVQEGDQQRGHERHAARDADALPLRDLHVQEAAHHKLPRVHPRDGATLACKDRVTQLLALDSIPRLSTSRL